MNLNQEMENLRGTFYVNFQTGCTGKLEAWSWSDRADIFEVRYRMTTGNSMFLVIPYSGHFIGQMTEPIQLKIAMAGFAQKYNNKLFKLVFL